MTAADPSRPWEESLMKAHERSLHPECFCRETYPQMRAGVVTHGPGCPHRDAHRDCWFGEPCGIGKPSECPPCIAEAKRDKGGWWSALEVRRESGGLRHYLDGQPVHCGYALLLQDWTIRSDDYGDYTRAEPNGTLVRYEAQWLGDRIEAWLYAELGGHEFRCRLDEQNHRFRWPGR